MPHENSVRYHIPIAFVQGLEEMKETAREINEAVALGKETEVGINEVSVKPQNVKLGWIGNAS